MIFSNRIFYKICVFLSCFSCLTLLKVMIFVILMRVQLATRALLVPNLSSPSEGSTLAAIPTTRVCNGPGWAGFDCARTQPVKLWAQPGPNPIHCRTKNLGPGLARTRLNLYKLPGLTRPKLNPFLQARPEPDPINLWAWKFRPRPGPNPAQPANYRVWPGPLHTLISSIVIFIYDLHHIILWSLSSWLANY